MITLGIVGLLVIIEIEQDYLGKQMFWFLCTCLVWVQMGSTACKSKL